MGLLSNPWIHPFGAILREFFIVAPHVRIVVVQLGEEIMQLRRIFRLQRANHSCFQEFAEGVGFFTAVRRRNPPPIWYSFIIVPPSPNQRRGVRIASPWIKMQAFQRSIPACCFTWFEIPGERGGG